MQSLYTLYAIKINAIKIVSLVIPKILNLLVKNKTTESKKIIETKILVNFSLEISPFQFHKLSDNLFIISLYLIQIYKFSLFSPTHNS